jgi:hypothetical protein
MRPMPRHGLTGYIVACRLQLVNICNPHILFLVKSQKVEFGKTFYPHRSPCKDKDMSILNLWIEIYLCAEFMVIG